MKNSLGAPKVEKPFLGWKLVPKAEKHKILEKSINKPLGICQKNKCTEFQEHPTMFGLSRLPRRFSVHFWAKNASPGPKNQNFKKMKKTPPGICPKSKCTKFQPDTTIYGVSSLPQSFCAQTDRQTNRQTNRQTDILRF